MSSSFLSNLELFAYLVTLPDEDNSISFFPFSFYLLEKKVKLLGHLNYKCNNSCNMDNFHKKLTTISVSHANYLTLKELGKTGDSFNDVLTRILNETMQLRSGQNSVA